MIRLQPFLNNILISEAGMPNGYLIITVDGPNYANDQQLPVPGNLGTDIEDNVEGSIMPRQNLDG